MRKGSITVFLSLILVLLFSFLMTTLEAARIQGAKAYLSMVSNLAGDSFLAGYYYPLFQDYRLFSVNAGDEAGNFSSEMLREELQTNVSYGMEGLSGGLLRFRETAVEIKEYTTLLSDQEAFLSQVRQQALLDGLTLPLQEMFSGEQLKEAAMAGKLYQEQEEALEATAAVTTELLKLMELADGVSVTNSGIRFDKEGNIRVKESFLKQILPLEKVEIKRQYENKEVYSAVSGSFFRVESEAAKIKNLLVNAEEYAKKISSCERRLESCDLRIEMLEEKLKNLSSQEETEETEREKVKTELEEQENRRKEEKKTKKNYEKKRSDVLESAKTQYNGLKKNLQEIREKTEEALLITKRIEKKQEAAQITIEAYETFLSGTKSEVSEELFQTFSGELEMMKNYAGLNQSGIYPEQIRESLTANRNLLSELTVHGFSKGNLSENKKEMDAIINRMPEYTAEGLWFSYGELTAAKNSGEDVTGALKELLSQGILSLVGVEEDAISKKCLEGKNLPSGGKGGEKQSEELMEYVTEVLQLLQDGEFEKILEEVQGALSDKTALELYSRKYFGCYGEVTPDTRLDYEREYLIFGEKEDKDNLRDMVLYLLAIRTLFCMVMILKQPDRMAELESFATGVAGCTGIPVLAAVVKYSVLLLWAVEEALVEVSVLLQGKKLSFMGTGCVEFYELFALSKEAIVRKAKTMPERGGIPYSGYLTFLSLLKGTSGKAYRVMDLVQENIRLRYNDGFRMENQVTGLSYIAKAGLKPMFDTGFFEPEVYETEYGEEVCFGACS